MFQSGECHSISEIVEVWIFSWQFDLIQILIELNERECDINDITTLPNVRIPNFLKRGFLSEKLCTYVR